MPTVVCRDNSLEVYVLGDTCVPPDYTVCDSMLPACPDACEGLGEGECAAAPGCVGHFGAPHLEQGDMTCVDYNNLEFLACDAAHPPCPPVVLTVCPQGQPDVAFDVGSGCVPPGFEVCGDEPVPDCR